MSQREPLISILVNCYNSEKYLKECLDSLINQSYQNIEIIVWDNASIDNTSNIVSQFSDERIRYFLSDVHRNLVESRIRAWSKIKGDYVAIMDSDDKSFEHRISIQFDLIKKDENIAVVGGGVKFIDANSENLSEMLYPINHEKIQLNLNYKFMLNNSTLFFDKKKVDLIGGYSNDWEFINDYELVYRLSKCYKIVNADIFICQNRLHINNLSNKKFQKMQNELLKFLQKINKNNSSILIKLLNYFEQFKCLLRIFNNKFKND